MSPAMAAPSVLTPEERLRLNHEAGEWWVRRQQAPWTAADEQALAQWLAGDPQRPAAFEGVQRSWDDAAQLQRHFPQAYGNRRGSRAAAARPATRSVSPWAQALQRLAQGLSAWGRGPALGAALTVVLCVGLFGGGYGWYRWSNTPRYTLDIATAPGETRTVELPDGSRIDLNTHSALRVRYYAQRREAVLDRGEAFFQVAPNADKPFTVDSGASQVRVLGTSFNVRAAPPALVVQVREGRVEVRADRDRADLQALVMGPGAGVSIDAGTRTHRPVPTVAGSVGEWRSGQIYFKRAPLRDVAHELSRYLDAPVSVEGEALGATPVSGLLALGEPERFLLALPSLIEVRVDRLADGHWHIAPR